MIGGRRFQVIEWLFYGSIFKKEPQKYRPLA
jgi:hypothetical protein